MSNRFFIFWVGIWQPAVFVLGLYAVTRPPIGDNYFNAGLLMLGMVYVLFLPAIIKLARDDRSQTKR
jgi:hypothetical protein